MNFGHKMPNVRIRDLILQYCKEEGLQETFYALRRESRLVDEGEDEDDGSFETPDSIDNLNVLRQAVELYDAVKKSESTAPVRHFEKQIKNLLTTSTTSYRTEARNSVIVKRKAVHDYIHKGNIIAVASHPTLPNMVATTGADKRICITNLKSKSIISVVSPTSDERMPSVALSLDFHPARPHLLLVGYINGAVSLFEIPQLRNEHVPSSEVSSTDSASIPEAILVASWKPHEKFTIAVQFTLDGFGFVTGGHDNKVAIFKSKMQPTESEHTIDPEYECVKEIVFKGQVEAISRIYPKADDSKSDEASSFCPEQQESKDLFELPQRCFAISVRSDHNILFLDLDAADIVGLVNMNAVGDDHVSFTALSLACSPKGQLLLAATDSHRVIMFHIPSRSIIKNFYGANNGDMSAPRVSWGPSGSMTSIICTGQDNSIHVWDSHTQQQIGTSVDNHKKRMRDFTVSLTDSTLYSVSFDQTLIEWVVEKKNNQ